MNEAQVCLIKSGFSIAKIHSHTRCVAEKCEVCAVHVRPTGMSWLSCTCKGQLINGYFKGAICFLHNCCQIGSDVSSHQLAYNNVSTAKTVKSPLLTASLRLQSAPAETVTENTRTCFPLSVFPSGRENFDSTSGTSGTEARWFWDEAQQSYLIRPSGPGSFGNVPPAHIVLHLPPWRNCFRELAKAQWKSSELPIPPLWAHPWGLIWSCQANPFWQDASCTAGTTA